LEDLVSEVLPAPPIRSIVDLIGNFSSRKGGTMTKFKRSIIAITIVATCIVAAAVLFSPQIRAQVAEKVKSGITSVLVVNGPNEPVPVAGSVTIANDTLSIRDVDTPVRTSYQSIRQTTLGNTGNVRNNFEVPDGKRLVVEQISAVVETSPATCLAVFLNVRVTNAQAFNFPIALTFASSFNLYAMADKTALYADQDIAFDARTIGVCDYQQVTMNVSGYLIDRP
jgi:hypothetical protein